jgi:hypothetical protein
MVILATRRHKIVVTNIVKIMQKLSVILDRNVG